MRTARDSIAVSLFYGALLLSACGDNPRTNDASTTPPPVPANTAAPIPAPVTNDAVTPVPNSSAPVVPPDAATDVEAKKESEGGIVGGAAGIPASGGSAGSGTDRAAGTAPGVSSGEKTQNEK